MPNDVQRVRFPARGSFHADLKRRAEAYFEGAGRSRHGGWAMGAKSAALLAWLAASWGLLMFGHPRAWEAALLSNNVLHHTYPNISGHDPDIEAGSPLLRLAPWQPRRLRHRFQHLYVWLLYGLFPLQWWFLHDIRELATGRIGTRQFPPPRGWPLFAAIAGKVIFVSWAFVLPAVVHPSWALLPLWGLAIFTLGNVLAAVFQLAHCVENAEFLGSDGIETDWAVHQISTTVDFAPANRLLGWYLGGLNFQVEHHLFPQVCHLHYPALARMVEQTCLAHGVRYRCQPTLGDALASNWRWLRQMGSPLSA